MKSYFRRIRQKEDEKILEQIIQEIKQQNEFEKKIQLEKLETQLQKLKK